MKIIAMLPVKNEDWVLEHCLKSLSFCDEIIAIDDNSTDSTRSILEKYKCSIVKMDTTTDVGWKEYDIRNHLLKVAREHGATHLIAIDADEIFSDSFTLEARNIFKKLLPGESISLPWINVSSEKTIMVPTVKKVFAMADDKTSNFEPGFIHIPRVPTNTATITLDIPYAVIHLQYLNKKRNDYKRTWYMMSEFLHKKRSAYRINTTYRITKELKEVIFNISQLYEKSLPNPNNDNSIWQKDKVEELFHSYSYEFFESLDIWDNYELRQKFIAKYGRHPKIKMPNELLLKLNKIKNKIKNFLFH